jgi:hypothetical protein
MPQSANIKITTHGAGVGPFNLYALDTGGHIIQTLELNVPLSKLTVGYNIFNVLDAANAIRIQSNNTLCTTVVNKVL